MADLLLTVLLVLACVLGGVMLIVLLLPVHVSADGQLNVVLIDGEAEARWGWGLVSVRMDPEHGAWLRLVGRRVRRVRRVRRLTFARTGGRAEDVIGDGDDGESRGERELEQQGRRGLGWFLRHRKTLMRVFDRLYRALGIRARVEGAAGLDDPGDTAILWGILIQLQALLPNLELAVEPDFLEENLDLEGWIRGRIWPAHLLAVIVGQLARRDTRQMLRARS